jgi:hypothetical protein
MLSFNSTGDPGTLAFEMNVFLSVSVFEATALSENVLELETYLMM